MMIFAENLKEFTKMLVELITVFGTFTRYEINGQWSILYVQVNTKNWKLKIFTVAWNTMKYFGVNLVTYVQDCHTENHETLQRNSTWPK